MSDLPRWEDREVRPRRTIRPEGRDEWIRYLVRVLVPVAVSAAAVYLGVDANTPSRADVEELGERAQVGGVADSVTAEAIRAMAMATEALRGDVDLLQAQVAELERQQRATEERVKRLTRKRGGSN